MSGGRLAGFRPLLHATAKQDARQIAPWVILTSVLSVTSVLAFSWVFPDPASQAVLSRNIASNPAFGLIFGPARDLTTAEGFNDWRALALGGFFAGLMAIFIVVRHTRGDEDSGQAELIASAVVSRHTRLAVAVALAAIASIAMGIVTTVATTLVGSSFWAAFGMGATYTASGLMFAGVGAVAAQIASDAHTANTLAVGVLGGLFLIRGYLDASGNEDWSWVTPLGWTQEVRPATDRRWWWLVPCLALAALLVGLANGLLARRDFGLGLIPPTPGPARSSARWPLGGLARRIHLSASLSWAVGFVVIGAVFGFLATSLGEVFGKNPLMAAALASGVVSQETLTAGFLSMMLRMMGIIAAVYGVQAVMRFYAEELEHRVEPLLGAAVSRVRLFASVAAVALLGPAVALLIGGTVTGLVATRQAEGLTMSGVVGQAVAETPAVWVLVGIALLVIGARPAARMAPWLAVVATFALTILGPLFRLWDWILGISPLWHVPTINAPDPSYRGLVIVGLIALALVGAGFAGYRRRDVL
jgi:ABC-2 type transport system permease protein